jgi:Resolvase, N terminal domain
MDALTAAGVDATRVYTDKLSGTSTRQQRPGLAALLDYARQGDVIVVVGIDRLVRNAAEVMTTIRGTNEGGGGPAITFESRERVFPTLRRCVRSANVVRHSSFERR